jgi:hypothetical protein
MSARSPCRKRRSQAAPVAAALVFDPCSAGGPRAPRPGTFSSISCVPPTCAPRSLRPANSRALMSHPSGNPAGRNVALIATEEPG